MDYRFYLNDLEIEEPIGWADFELSMKRDDTYHGMQFLASTGTLRFWGIGAEYLEDQKNQFTVSAQVTFKAESTCEDTYTEIISGRLNFGKYKDQCGDLCIVEIPFEEDSCTVIFNNRFDNKVDIDSLMATDNTTVLPNYGNLGGTIQMPAKALQAAVDGSVALTGDAFQVEYNTGDVPQFQLTYLRPEYSIERYNNIKTGQLTGGQNCQSGFNFNVSSCPTAEQAPITPQLLFEDDINCFDGNFTYTSRLKGSFVWNSGVKLVEVTHVIYKWDGNGDIINDGELVQSDVLFSSGGTTGDDSFLFDSTLAGTTTIADGVGFYAFLIFNLQSLVTPGFSGTVDVTFDSNTLFRIEAIKVCPPTFVQYYMLHEALSRVVENVTNGCIRVKSEYFGRTDSQPYAFPADGCGGLRMLTSGLKLRNAPNAKMFASAKDLISGLNAIDNIGFGITPDPTFAAHSILQIEAIDFFYKDAQVLQLDAIPVVSNEIQENLHYAKINVGYKKWEVESVNGLNEFNSNREYRTNVETISTTLDITSVLVAGNYPIEVTRQQNFADSGAADTTYDNEIFIICLERDTINPFKVELNKILNPLNIFDPATVKNYRISPIRNLRRWFRSIAPTYANVFNSGSRLFFNAGTGNFIAQGQLTVGCVFENGSLAENQSIGITNFAIQADAIPLFKNEFASFDYPLSVAEWNILKANPYGYIAYTCGTSATVQKGFIKEVKYRPAKGMANFTLRKKWGA